MDGQVEGSNRSYDVVVIGSGPNGLSAAILAARAGLSTIVFETHETAGGGARSAELTLPGFRHDVCSAVHPMGAASPWFRELPLQQFGLEWITPPAAAAHPLDGTEAALLANRLEETVERLGADGKSYARWVGSIAARWNELAPDLLKPIGLPAHPFTYVGFGAKAILPATALAKLAFKSPKGRALFAGNAAHSILPLSDLASSAIGLVLCAVAHVHGWPVPRGGSQAITDALCGHLRAQGGEIVTGFTVKSHRELPAARALLFDTSPRALARIMGDRLPSGYARRLERYRYGPGAFKIDWALGGPIPWRAGECAAAATVHVGGTLEEIARSEAAPWQGRHAEKPFVLVTQPSLFDPTRAPPGRHTAWGYCHVPSGSDVDQTDRIEAQIERFAPGFRDLILARSVRPPSVLERENPNLVGGDVGGGSNAFLNTLFRPTHHFYRMPARGVYLCSASTPPGGGVHGMCGYHAAAAAIRREFGVEPTGQG
jgi:phytoene dehydrogenase-like protein